MNTPEQSLLKQLNRSFTVTGTATVNAEGKIDVTGNVTAKNRHMQDIPVSFGTVSGDFVLGLQQDLTSLKNCPDYVGGDFRVRALDITSLDHAPHTVKGQCVIGADLDSLENLPDGSRNYRLSWTPTLPMLRLVLARQVIWSFPVEFGGISAGWEATKIVDRYVGRGQASAMALAAELAAAGFKGNARW